MKITKERLMEIISEEIGNLGGDQEASPIADPESGADVKYVGRTLDKIDTTKEYQDLVELVMKWGGDIPRKQAILRALYKQLPELIKSS